MPFPGTTVLGVPHLPLRVPLSSTLLLLGSVLADSAATPPPRLGYHTQPAYSLQQDSSHLDIGLDHQFPISCDPALSFVPKPHHPTWLYPPLSCLGYRVWKPHKHHPHCQTSNTLFGPTARHLLHTPSQPNKRLRVLSHSSPKRLQHPHSSVGSRFRKGGHLWSAIRPVPPAHRLQTSPTQTMRIACQ